MRKSLLTLLVVAFGLATAAPALAQVRPSTDSDLYSEDAPHTSGDKGRLILGVRTASCGAALSGSASDYNVFQFDAQGNLCINLATNSAGSRTDSDDGTVAPAQDSIALTINLPYIFDGTNWVRDSGLSIYRSIDLDEGTGEVIKSAPGQLFALWVTNRSSTTRYIKLYNATSCTMGTGTPVITLPIPGNATDNIAGHFTAGGKGIAFTTGICFGATTGLADADTGAPAANDVVANAFYK